MLQRTLSNRVEELLAYLERTKQLREGPDSAINMEYLKNCVFKFMSSSDLSEKRRLYPVIATILKLTGQEMKAIEGAFRASEERENEFENTLSSIGSFATASFGSLWGSATSSLLGDDTTATASSSSSAVSASATSNNSH